ncbi:DUF6787 family protein [Flavobacteriaceae bacterium M23B6Z8]
MKKFKERWEINANWQLVFPFLGIIALVFSAFLISKNVVDSVFPEISSDLQTIFYLILSCILFYLILQITLWLFNKLERRWQVKYRWELISIFLVFAVTGSASARVSGPLLDYLGFERAIFASAWYWSVLYWSIRILIIFPIYQVLLIIVGALFGQYKFFRSFEEKMLSRMGFSFLFSSKRF